MTDYLDLDDLAALLGIDRGAAYARVRSGELPGIKTGSGWYVERGRALQYQDSQ